MVERTFKYKKKKPSKPGIEQALAWASKGVTLRSPPTLNSVAASGISYKPGPLYGLSTSMDKTIHSHPDISGRDSDPKTDAILPEIESVTGGEPLDPVLRKKLEKQIGYDFGTVRVHTGRNAQALAGAMNARAFTHRRHIWLGARTDQADTRVMAHELAHVVQQGYAAPLKHRGPVAFSPVRPAPPAGSRPAPGAAAPPAPGTAAVQRLDIWDTVTSVGGAVVSGVSHIAGGVAGLVEDGLEMGRDALLAAARRVAPDFTRLFERDGIRGFLRQMLSRGIQTLFRGPLAAIRRMFNIEGIGERFGQVAAVFLTIAGQLARGDCSSILRVARQFGEFMSETFEPVIETVRGISRSISEFFSSIWDAVGAPVMDLFRRIGGSVWESIRGFIRDVGRVINRVREALGPAWEQVKSWVGIAAETGTEEGGRLWNWIRDTAGEIWESIRAPLEPYMGTLRTVGTVLVLISPAGPVLLAIEAWPYLRQAYEWVRQQWQDLNLMVRAREFMANTVLPAVESAAQRVGDALVNAADWLLGMLIQVAQGVQNVSGRLSGGILAPLGRVIQFLSGRYRMLVNWARSGLRYVAANARSLFRRLIEFIQPIITVFRRIMIATINPAAIPGIIMGSIWQIIPRCLKGPIIDFILDVVLRFLRSIPPLPQLGILWPFIRAAMVGFLQRVRSFATERKVNVADKIAGIIAGDSLDFVIGYLRGIILGLWDGITGPFLAIRDLFQLPGMIRNFLRSLGLRLCDFMRAIRCFIGTIRSNSAEAFDSLMEAAGDLLNNPGRIVELIRCAIQTALSAVEGVGASIAGRLMALFEGPESRIGESLGRLVGSALLDVVLAYFTAGSSTALTVIRQIAGVLRTVGRNVMRIVRMVANLIPRFMGFIRRLGGMFRQAGSRAGGLLGRIGQFFRRIANWFRRLMRRAGRRFQRRRSRRQRSRRRRSGGGRDRNRGPSRAERERRKRLVERILRERLTRGIGKIRLRLLMIALKLRHRIRRLYIRRIGRRRRELVIRNSQPARLPFYEIHIEPGENAGEHRARMEQRRRGQSRSRTAHVVLQPDSIPIPTPREMLRRAGCAVMETFRARAGVRTLMDVDPGDIHRPRKITAIFRRFIPRNIIRPPGSDIEQGRKARLGYAEGVLRHGGYTTPRLWQGGHLIANRFGGPAAQWNLVPMTVGLNERAYAAAEHWLHNEWDKLRRPGGHQTTSNPRAKARVEVYARGYRNFVPSPSALIRLGIRRRNSDSPCEVRIHGFIPSTIFMEVNFRGRGVVGREFVRRIPGSWESEDRQRRARAETALQTTTINNSEDVMMRISPLSENDNANLPPTEDLPRSQRRILINNRTSFNFRQWQP